MSKSVMRLGLSMLPAPLFKIGAKPLQSEDWFDIDDHLERYLDEKERLGRGKFTDVFAQCGDTQVAQQEVLDLLVDHLLIHHSHTYKRTDDRIDILPADRSVDLVSSGLPPLWVAAQLVQDDLLLMRREEAGWRLVAGVLCFPSSWRLTEKIGRLMDAIHGHVPGFGEGTRSASLIARMFDAMRAGQQMVRGNWSLYGDDALYHPEEGNSGAGRLGLEQGLANVFLRQERQTLTKLPTSGDILFTVRIYVDPATQLAKAEGGAEIARALIVQLNELDAAQLAYKGLTNERDGLVARLAEIAI